MLGKHPDRDTFADAVNRPVVVAFFSGGGMCFFQQAIDGGCTDFHKLIAEYQIQTEMPVFLHRRNELGQ
ncbi:hypothetical protein D1797_15430 [Salmonella enterica subsp. enterica serovar Freetown]|nr:hypothetical protein [Salmonella enterica subsp. enterica serovar Freetown]EBH8792426.1 hypothetical protein [Salmonella enterica subsp. enterica serovar Freetown]EBN9932845.1 hypothetical protein [Salmonella enterica]EBP0843346.1 hypothetical protein [Salmonella enterica]